MKQQTFYHIILDQSGSMQSCIDDTLSGYNEQLQMIRSLQQRNPDQEIRVGLTCFNHQVNHLYFAEHPDKVPELDQESFRPSGNTALYDAMGSAIVKLDTLSRAENNHQATFVVVVITDGHDNSSKLYTLEKIKSLVTRFESGGRWTFSYLGATWDAVRIASTMNIKEHNSMSFRQQNIKDTFETLAASMDDYLVKKKEGKNLSVFLKDKES